MHNTAYLRAKRKVQNTHRVSWSFSNLALVRFTNTLCARTPVFLHLQRRQALTLIVDGNDVCSYRGRTTMGSLREHFFEA